MLNKIKYTSKNYNGLQVACDWIQDLEESNSRLHKEGVIAHGGDIGIEESMPMAAVSSLAQAGSSNAQPPSSDKRSTSRIATSECKSRRQAPQSGLRKAGWINL